MSRNRRCRRDRRLARQVEQLTRAVRELQRQVLLERDLKQAGRIMSAALKAGQAPAPDYWNGWADGYESGILTTEGRFRDAMHKAGTLPPDRPVLRVVPNPEVGA